MKFHKRVAYITKLTSYILLQIFKNYLFVTAHTRFYTFQNKARNRYIK